MPASKQTNTSIKQESSSSSVASNPSPALVSEAQQLLKDLAAIRQKRKCVENEIQAHDLAVFNLETNYLKIVGTPRPVVFGNVSNNSTNNREMMSKIVGISSSSSSSTAIRRDRDGNSSTTKNEEEDDETLALAKQQDQKEEKKKRRNWIHNHLPTIEDHVSAIRFGDASAEVTQNSSNSVNNTIGASQFIRTINPNERMASLTNYTSMANNAKNGVVDQS